MDVLTLLAAQQYDRLQILCGGVRLSALELQRAVAEYGRTLIPPPTEAAGLIDYVEILDSQPRAWSVRVPVFTREEGRSDLTLELTLCEAEAGGYLFELDGLHVL